ncbi:hypothetical protein RRG08_029518 [Elysia crispata]|uniref:Uncharacterized protein n=1 Tax=Elysia crispata TaxID=231223 RepID=A0AAE1CMY7_9GAST|nr:hypothetical protein RRG08_029518 [Elysia crispata]
MPSWISSRKSKNEVEMIPEGAGAGHPEPNVPTPVTSTSRRSPPNHTIESRPTPTSSLEAGQPLEGTGAGQEELKLRGAIQGEKITFPLPIPGIITCDLCRPQPPGGGRNPTIGTPCDTCRSSTTLGLWRLSGVEDAATPQQRCTPGTATYHAPAPESGPWRSPSGGRLNRAAG